MRVAIIRLNAIRTFPPPFLRIFARAVLYQMQRRMLGGYSVLRRVIGGIWRTRHDSNVWPPPSEGTCHKYARRARPPMSIPVADDSGDVRPMRSVILDTLSGWTRTYCSLPARLNHRPLILLRLFLARLLLMGYLQQRRTIMVLRSQQW